MKEIRFRVAGYPPTKNEALSMLGGGHSHAARVLALLDAAGQATEGQEFQPFVGPIGLDVVVFAPTGQDPWDATNYLGGIGDVLENKDRRGALPHLGRLRAVSLYLNDRQIQEVHYRQTIAGAAGYEVRIYELGSS